MLEPIPGEFLHWKRGRAPATVAMPPRAPHSIRMADEADIAGLSFEEALKRLETIVGRLESGEAALQEAIDLYEEGDRLRRQCAARLDAAQARIEAIRVDAEGRASGTAPFTAG